MHRKHLTQGQFSFLPALGDEQIAAQLRYALAHGWMIQIEYTDDPAPQNNFWERFGIPMFDPDDVAPMLAEINACRQTFPKHYIRVTAFDRSHGVGTLRMMFIVHEPIDETGSAGDATA